MLRWRSPLIRKLPPKTDEPIIKTEAQISNIRRSCKLAANALQYAGKILQIGITTAELDDLINQYILNRGGIAASLNYQGFPRATCISLNNVICHGIPDDTVIKEGDIVKVDIATILDGYFGDNCKTFLVGECSDAAKHIATVAERCLLAGIAAIKPGAHFGNIGRAVTDVATENRCSVVYQFAGHGVGLRYHEPPTLCYTAKAGTGGSMKKNMIFTVEPMLNLGQPDAVVDIYDHWTARTVDGKLSAQFEHTVLVVDEGCEVLTIPDNE